MTKIFPIFVTKLEGIECRAELAALHNLLESTTPPAHPWGRFLSHLLGDTTSLQQTAQSAVGR